MDFPLAQWVCHKKNPAKIATCGCRTATERIIFATGGVTKLIHFMAGRANELWNVVDLVPLTFSHNHNPRKPIATFQAPAIDSLHGHLALPFGNHVSQIAVTLGTGALEALGHGTIELRRRCRSRHP
jgi:hypothetical protein